MFDRVCESDHSAKHLVNASIEGSFWTVTVEEINISWDDVLLNIIDLADS